MPNPLLVVEPMDVSMCREVASWVADRKTHFYWAANSRAYPVDVNEFEERVATIPSDDPQSGAFALRDAHGGDLRGYYEISVDLDNRSGRLGGFLIGPSTVRGQGLGLAAMWVIEDRFFEDGALHRLDLVVATDNPAAIACYRHAGFQDEGVLRDSRRFGDEWRSVQVMSLLRDEWATSR